LLFSIEAIGATFVFLRKSGIFVTKLYKGWDTEASKTEFSRSPDILADRPKPPACKLKAATGFERFAIVRSSDRGLNATASS
jgi:hypothetical protein